MVVSFTLPFGKGDGVKDLVFTILSKEYPLRIVDLMQFIRKRYGKSVSFQAVRKAVLELKNEGVLTQEETKFLINAEWVIEAKGVLDELYMELTNEKRDVRKMDAIGEEVSVFTFNSLNEMMRFWQDLIDKWFKNFKKGDYKINCYQAAHAWEGLLHLDREKKTMGQLKQKGIVSSILSAGNTLLDKNIKRFYERIGIHFVIDPSRSSFDRSHYVATYGDLIVQAQYPPDLVSALDIFFRKNSSLKDLNLGALSDIVNKKTEIKLTVIKNLAMAKQINRSIMDRMI